MAQKKNRRNAIIAALAVLVVALAVGGTIAWMTAQDQLHNTFTVGTIGKPTKPAEPDTGGDEDEEEDTDGTAPNGYLFETEWDENVVQELSQGVPRAKNPNVGINTDTGKDAYVFLYVVNDSLTVEAAGDQDALAKYAPYFYLERQWSPVTDDLGATGVSPIQSTPGNTTKNDNDADRSSQTAYVSGLFMYTGSETKKNLPAALRPSAAQEGVGNVYTGELFEDVTIPNNLSPYANVEEVIKNGKITVYAYIYAVDDNAQSGDGTAAQALNDAIAWANDMKTKVGQ